MSKAEGVTNLPRPVLSAIVFGAVLLCGFLDYLTGPEIGFALFYLIPVAGGAWFVSERIGTVLAVAAAAIWLLADLSWGVDYSHPVIPYWNAVVRLSIFLIVSVLVSRLRKSHGTLERKVHDKTAALKEELTRHEAAKKDLVQLNRLYAVLTSVNQAIVRASNEQELLDKVCRITVGEGKFKAVWIGMVDHETHSLEVRAYAGQIDGIFDRVRFPLSSSYQTDPISGVIESGESFVDNNAVGEDSLSVSKGLMRVRYNSWACFPLKKHEKTIGTFSVYSDHVRSFDRSEVKLLTELTTDISFYLEFQEETKERNKAREALRLSEQKYKAMFDSAPVGIYQSTMDGRFLTANVALARMLGYGSVNELLGRDIKEDVYYRPGEREALINENSPTGSATDLELQWKKKDGRPTWIQLNAFAVKDESGSIKYFEGYVRDIDERKRVDADRKELEARLAQSQRLESLGTLAGGIAHDFNNILGIIIGHSTLLKDRTPDARELHQRGEAITNAGQRGAALVNQLLTFARQTATVLQPVQVNELVNELLGLLRETFPKTIIVSTSLDPRLPLIHVDATQIHQVLLNLCVNARDAMPKGGILSITTGTIDGENIGSRVRNQAARVYVEITVRDTGIGMDETARRRIFEPFFSTKDVGKGTGLGLSVVFGIVDKYSGFIDVESKPGEGSVFRVLLPVEQHLQSPAKATARALDDAQGGTETILLVEDEEPLRELLKGLLLSRGYSVISASTGNEGLEQFLRYRDKIAVVVSDLGLPGLSGDALFRKIREVDQNANVILASGFAEKETTEDLFKVGLRDFIQKPYLPLVVLKKIRNVIDSAKGANSY